MAAVTACAIRCRGLRFVYPDGRAAVRGVDLALEPGERVALVGGNGVGKSTLLWLISGLLFGDGALEIGGESLTRRTAPALRTRVGLLFQNPDDQLFCPTVGEDVAFGPSLAGKDAAETASLVEGALQSVGLAGFAERAPHHLSLGEKKRAALATVLGLSPGALLLDEPTGHLDPRGRRELAELLAALPQTQLIATHDLDFARALCPRAAVMAEGRLIAVGPTAAVLDDPRILDAAGLR